MSTQNKFWTASETEIAAVPLPERTKSYSPIPHLEFIQEVQRRTEDAGYRIDSKNYSIKAGGNIMTGEFLIHSMDDFEMGMSIGMQNSYNKTTRAAVYGGALVLTCSNGMYHSEDLYRYTRKHTGAAREELYVNIDGALSEIKNSFEKLVEDKERMKSLDLNKNTIATLIGDLYLNQELITHTQLGIIKKELAYSSAFKEKTAWSLYNHITEAYKTTHPAKYLSTHMKLHAYMSDKFDLSGKRGLYGKSIFSKQTMAVESVM